MKVQLSRRWGRHKPGQTVDVHGPMALWLIDRGFGVKAQPEPPAAPPAPEPKPRTPRKPRTPKVVDAEKPATRRTTSSN